MSKLSKRHSVRSSQGEIRPFEGMTKVSTSAAGVDIGAHEIMACVPDGDDHQVVRAFGTYTADLEALADWFVERSIQTVAMESTGVYCYGLLSASFRPDADLVALRTLWRYRAPLIEHRAPHVLHMQQALLQMNIQLSQALSDVTGATGQRIIRAIVAGERDPHASPLCVTTAVKRTSTRSPWR